MTKPTIQQTKIKVGVRDTDFNAKMKLSSILRHFQEAASLHVDNLGIGITDLDNKGHIAWLLAKVKISVMRYPKLKENISIITWPQLPGPIEYQRDFIIKDEKGNIIVKALTSWIVVDTKTREIKRSSLIPLDHLTIHPERPLGKRFYRFKPSYQTKEIYQRTVGYSDIDIMGHLNNAKYLDFVLDCFSIKEHQNMTISEAELHFSKEALPGDKLKMAITDIETGINPEVYVEGIKSSGNEIAFKAKITKQQ